MQTAKEITDKIYKLYGSDSGYLFGIKPEYKSVVESIVSLTITNLLPCIGCEYKPGCEHDPQKSDYCPIIKIED